MLGFLCGSGDWISVLVRQALYQLSCPLVPLSSEMGLSKRLSILPWRHMVRHVTGSEYATVTATGVARCHPPGLTMASSNASGGASGGRWDVWAAGDGVESGGWDNRQMLVTCLGFATACVPNDKHRVSNLKQLLQLHNLQHEAVLRLQLELHYALLDDLGDKAEYGARRRPLVWMSLQVLALMSHRAPTPDPSVTLRVLKPRTGWGTWPQDPCNKDQASLGVIEVGGGENYLLKIQVSLPGNVQGGEKVPDQPHEHGQVISHDLGDIEVPQRPHEHLVLCPGWVPPLQGAGHHQHRLDGPQAPVIVILWGWGQGYERPSYSGQLATPGSEWI